MADKVTLTALGSIQNDPTAVATINSNMVAITTAMDNTLSRDGTQPNTMGSSLDMNSFRILNLPSPLNGDEPLRLTDASILNGGGTIGTFPVGGTAGQVLAKNSSTDFDVHWISESSDLVAGTNISITGTSPATISLVAAPTTLGTNITGTAAGLTAGNVTTNANLTGVITSVGNATSIASQTGTGTKFVVDTSPTLVTPLLGTPTSGVLTNCTGTASGLTAGNVMTNANLTGDVTSVGNATTLASVASAGTTGSSTAIPVITINAKGLTTGITTAAVVAPAGTLSGTTLASSVVTSSLTSFGSSIALGTPASGTLTNCTIPGTALSGTTVGGASSTTLASTIVTSSLTSLGTIAALTATNATVNSTLNVNNITGISGSIIITAPTSQSIELTVSGGVILLLQGSELFPFVDTGISLGDASHRFNGIFGVNLVGTTSILSSGTGGVGYATGAGGTVSQATNRTTGVTLNKTSGAITLFSQINSAVSAATAQSFTVTNSTVAITDTIIVNQKSGTDLYEIFVTNVGSGTFKITNYSTGGTTNEAPVFTFNVIKGVTS